MKRIISILLPVVVIAVACVGSNRSLQKLSKLTDHVIPSQLIGDFTDDYGITYTITDSVWIQHPRTRYHVIRWDTTAQYVIAKNGMANPSEAGLYTRIDYMYFKNMEPFHWGFCLTKYNAATDQEATAAASADRQNPRKGCGGYPFSRMKRLKE